MRNLVAFIQIIAVLLMSMKLSLAANGTPAGLWQSIDDKTNKPRSLIRISNHNGEFRAVIEKGLLPTDTTDAICDKCKDERKISLLLAFLYWLNLKFGRGLNSSLT